VEERCPAWRKNAHQSGKPMRMRSIQFTGDAKIVASRDEMIVGIISPLAFTFKIPFH
jgi:hypothetical protein